MAIKMKRLGATKFVARPVRPTVEVDITAFVECEEGEKCIIKLREPEAKDFFSDSKLRKRVLIAFPELAESDTLAAQVLMLGACLVPEPGDTLTEPWRFFGEMQRADKDAILYVTGKFAEAFPSYQDLMKEKTDAGNGSAQ